jgi:MFS family permease
VSPSDTGGDIDGRAAWFRLWATLVLATIGSFGMWAVVVILPLVQADFGAARGGASFPYTATMLCFAAGAIMHGRLADRFGILLPAVAGTVSLGVGCVLAAQASELWQFTLFHGVLIGFLGCSAFFGPMVADISRWFDRRRGLAVSIVASGNYLAGTIWPPLLTWAAAAVGWRQAYVWAGLAIVATMLPLTYFLRRRAPRLSAADIASASAALDRAAGIGVSNTALLALLVIAGFACCVAMSMPQVHIVAYCGDLGYGVARGAEMLSLMLGFGVVSRIVSGWISDQIGGIRTLVLGSVLQCLTLLAYLPSDALVSLYVVSALFGLAQGGIVPSYAIIVREVFPAEQAGARVGFVLMATIVGMAAGGWLSGLIFDLSGSYQMAFVHGIAWNIVNLTIAVWLMLRVRRRPAVVLA